MNEAYEAAARQHYESMFGSGAWGRLSPADRKWQIVSMRHHADTFLVAAGIDPTKPLYQRAECSPTPYHYVLEDTNRCEDCDGLSVVVVEVVPCEHGKYSEHTYQEKYEGELLCAGADLDR